MSTQISFGEYVRRLRKAKRLELQDLAKLASLSTTHLSRIENDRALPNPDTVVKLAAALEGDLNWMLELANCLPREILERLSRRVGAGSETYRRSGGAESDAGFPQALVEDIDPSIRNRLALHFGLSTEDVEGIFAVLERMGRMTPEEREAVISFLSPPAREGNP